MHAFILMLVRTTMTGLKKKNYIYFEKNVMCFVFLQQILLATTDS